MHTSLISIIILVIYSTFLKFSQGLKLFSVPIELDAKLKVDLVVVGSVAVSEKGSCCVADVCATLQCLLHIIFNCSLYPKITCKMFKKKCSRFNFDTCIYNRVLNQTCPLNGSFALQAFGLEKERASLTWSMQ